jgi:peptidoglycan/xylan/chitin deacetylase (PgdA/CDA1 family)
MKQITTSWDDGYILDFKLAELLQKYNLPATFYIPQTNSERPVMSPQQIKILAKDFEIGGHTLHHVRLRSADKEFLEEEIKGSYDWLCDLLGEAPVSFCFPGGVYNAATSKSVFQYGYKLARTTELFSTKSFTAGQVLATTLQAYPHSAFTYAKHLAKRKRATTLLAWLKGSETNLAKLAGHHLNHISKNGGCFHLWGHSWEIEEHDLWKELEELFKIISNRAGFTYVQNKGLI